MQLLKVALILLIICALGITINCQDAKEGDVQIDRHDIHRIVLKREKSKKHKKRTKSKSTRPPKHEENLFDLDPVRYQNTHQQQLSVADQYAPFDDVRELIKPRPPAIPQGPATYPEEGGSFPYRAEASSNRHNYVQKPHNSDWNPIPSTLMTYDYHQKPTKNADVMTTKTVTGKKRNRSKQTKRQRKPNVTTTMMTMTTRTPRPSTTTKSLPFPNYTYATHPPAASSKGHPSKSKSNATHYVNYNHNNKSQISYEVRANSKPKAFVSPFLPGPIQFPASNKAPPQQVPTAKTSFAKTTSNSYEVFESTNDYNKQIKQTRTFIPPPTYPQLKSFVPSMIGATANSKTPWV